MIYNNKNLTDGERLRLLDEIDFDMRDTDLPAWGDTRHVGLIDPGIRQYAPEPLGEHPSDKPKPLDMSLYGSTWLAERDRERVWAKVVIWAIVVSAAMGLLLWVWMR